MPKSELAPIDCEVRSTMTGRPECTRRRLRAGSAAMKDEADDGGRNIERNWIGIGQCKQERNNRNAVQERAIYAKNGVPTYTTVVIQAANDFVVLSYTSRWSSWERFDQSSRRTSMPAKHIPPGMLPYLIAYRHIQPAPVLIDDVMHVDQRGAELGL
jgi:hypothetical protein